MLFSTVRQLKTVKTVKSLHLVILLTSLIWPVSRRVHPVLTCWHDLHHSHTVRHKVQHSERCRTMLSDSCVWEVGDVIMILSCHKSLKNANPSPPESIYTSLSISSSYCSFPVTWWSHAALVLVNCAPELWNKQIPDKLSTPNPNLSALVNQVDINTDRCDQLPG